MAGRSESQPQLILLAAFAICAVVNICSRKIVRWPYYIRYAPDRGVEIFFNHFLEYFIRRSSGQKNIRDVHEILTYSEVEGFIDCVE
jgi:hypothetical protein